MANEEPETVVEDIDEDNSPSVDFKAVTAPTTDTKPQPKSQESPPVVVDEELAIKKDAVPSVEATKEDKSSEDMADNTKEQAVVKQTKYKLKEENRIPQARFNQVVRQRKIAEAQTRSSQQKHLDLLNDLERFQAQNPNIPLPKSIIDAVQATKAELQDMRTKQHEARLDEADEWFKAEMKKYVDSGFQFPPSLERELVAIIQAENLNTLSPLDAYQKAFSTWLEENVTSEDESLKAETSKETGSGKPVEKSVPDPKAVREDLKKKATGVSKAKAPTTPTKKDDKWAGHHYYAVDEDPKW